MIIKPYNQFLDNAGPLTLVLPDVLNPLRYDYTNPLPGYVEFVIDLSLTQLDFGSPTPGYAYIDAVADGETIIVFSPTPVLGAIQGRSPGSQEDHWDFPAMLGVEHSLSGGDDVPVIAIASSWYASDRDSGGEFLGQWQLAGATGYGSGGGLVINHDLQLCSYPPLDTITYPSTNLMWFHAPRAI